LVLGVAGAFAVLLLSTTPALAKSKDVNHNKIPDKWEIKYHLSIKKNLANKDADKDGLTNIQEYIAKTNPLTKDTNRNGVRDANEDPDKDRLTNAAEFKCKTNPLVADTNKDGTNDFNSDADNDGLSNGAEIAEGCDPRNPDSDHDGTIDGLEVAGFVTAYDADTKTVSISALNNSDCTYNVVIDDNTSLNWNAITSLDGSPTVDDLKAGALVTDADGTVQADGTVIATSIVLVPAPSVPLIANVSWFDGDQGWLELTPINSGDDYGALVTDTTTFEWAQGVYSDHVATADDLDNCVGVSKLDVKYNADGDMVIKKIVLVPNFTSDNNSWDDGSSDNGGSGNTE
jgi:hypothetical protein